MSKLSFILVVPFFACVSEAKISTSKSSLTFQDASPLTSRAIDARVLYQDARTIQPDVRMVSHKDAGKVVIKKRKLTDAGK